MSSFISLLSSFNISPNLVEQVFLVHGSVFVPSFFDNCILFNKISVSISVKLVSFIITFISDYCESDTSKLLKFSTIGINSILLDEILNFIDKISLVFCISKSLKLISFI